MPRTMCCDPICAVAEVWCCSEHYLWLWVAFWWRFLAGGIDCSVLIKKASSVIGCKQDTLEAVGERRTLKKLLSIMDNPLHPLHLTLVRERSIFSKKLLSFAVVTTDTGNLSCHKPSLLTITLSSLPDREISHLSPVFTPFLTCLHLHILSSFMSFYLFILPVVILWHTLTFYIVHFTLYILVLLLHIHKYMLGLLLQYSAILFLV